MPGELGSVINSENLKNSIRKMLFAGGLIAENEIIPLVPVDNGRLKGSITTVMDDKSSVIRAPASEGDKPKKPVNKYTCYIGTNVYYAMYMEFGTGSHKSSEGQQEFIDSITEWANRHGLPPYPVMRSIRKKGLASRAYMRNGFRQAIPKIIQYMQSNFSNIFAGKK